MAAVLVSAAAAAVYWPTLGNDFVTWDDPDYITNNPYVSDPDGLAKIWDPGAKHEQYYPLVFTSYWLEYKAWGFEPRGYHLTNLVLHALNAGVLVWLLRLLGVRPWAAWLAAGLFAVHPINVASVAWAAERKNVLSTLFYLLALGSYVWGTRGQATAKRPFAFQLASTGVCAALFILGLLSKTAVLTLPVSALLADRLILRRWSAASFLRITPLLVLALVAAIHTKQVEQANAGSLAVLEWHWRPLVAAGAVWFYLGKLLVPVHFPGIYPRWEPAACWPLLALATVGLVAAVWAAWRWRRRVPGQVHWGLAHFLVALAPMLGLVPFNYTQYSFVADHFVYLAGIGAFLAIAIGLDAARQRLPAAGRGVAGAVLACGLLIGLGLAGNRHAATAWQDAESFWTNTVTLNPRCFAAQYNLANLRIRRGDLPSAAEHYRHAAAARPDLHQPLGRLGATLAQLGDQEAARIAYEAALRIVPQASVDWVNYRHALATLHEQRGDVAQAEQYLRAAADAKPHLFRVQVRLARFLRQNGRATEAAEHYEAALRAVDRPADLTTVQRELAALRGTAPTATQER